MKIHARFSKDNPESHHQIVTLFINGTNTGFLVMSPEEAIWLNHILGAGCEALSPRNHVPIEYRASGIGPDATPAKIDAAVRQHS